MPKLAIYVPKKDWREIEKWRKKINFSKIFMRALDREIRDQSRSVKTPSAKLAAAADFYKQELADNSEPLLDFAFKLGTEHVMTCQLSPLTIRCLVDCHDASSPSKEAMAMFEKTLADVRSQIEKFAADHQYDDNTCPNWREIAYIGYAKGVAAAWEKVCEKMKAT